MRRRVPLSLSLSYWNVMIFFVDSVSESNVYLKKKQIEDSYVRFFVSYSTKMYCSGIRSPTHQRRSTTKKNHPMKCDTMLHLFLSLPLINTSTADFLTIDRCIRRQRLITTKTYTTILFFFSFATYFLYSSKYFRLLWLHHRESVKISNMVLVSLTLILSIVSLIQSIDDTSITIKMIGEIDHQQTGMCSFMEWGFLIDHDRRLLLGSNQTPSLIGRRRQARSIECVSVLAESFLFSIKIIFDGWK